MDQYFIRLSNARVLPRTLALCVVVLGLPSLAIGLRADDFVIAQRVLSVPWDAYLFFPGGAETNALRMQGVLNWSASHHVKLHLLRPLASLSHALDFTLWPQAVWLMHLENMLLYAAIVWIVALIYAELLGSEQSARLAAVFYAFCPGHAFSVGWVSSRNTLLSALLGLATILLFVRSKRGRTLAAVAPVGMHALALLAGEAAIAVMAPLIAYALVLDRGARRSRVLRVLPHVVLCGAYLVAYTKLGFGAAHGGMYLNAGQQTWAVLQNLLVAVPLYLHSSLVLPHAGLAGLLPSGLWLLVLLTCVTLALLAPWFLPVLRSDARARFFGLTALGSIVPLAAVPPQDRLVFLVGLGGCGLLALCLTAHGREPLRGWLPRTLFRLHTSAAVLAFVPLCFVCCSPAIGGGASALNEALTDPAGHDVVVLNVAVETVLMSTTSLRERDHATQPRSMRALYVGGAAYDVKRVDAQTIDVHVERAWFANALERLVRDPSAEPFASGDVETTDHFSARVLEVDHHGAPRRVRFQFVSPLEDARWLWLRFERGRAVPWTPPRVHETQHLSAAVSLF
jgi:hypothetical protein